MLKLELKTPSWPGLAQRQIKNLSQAWLGLKSKLDMQGKLFSGWEGDGISILSQISFFNAFLA